MAVTASNMYKRLTKSDSLESTPEDELPPEQPVAHKPLLGLYLVGWGIALIVCGISGAVNMREYAGYSHCFLMAGPALSAVFVPVGMLVLFLLIFYLLIRCSIQNIDANGQLSEGTQATENVDLDLLDSNIINTVTAEHTSLHSTSTPTASSDVEDLEHSPQNQLKAHVIVLLLYLLMWTSAAIATAKPFRNYLQYEEIIFSILYCFLSSCLGMFVAFFYCIARSDVRAQWHLMECWCKRRRGRCCRTRSISDTNPPLPASQPLAPITNVGPRTGNAPPVSSSNSINSSGHTSKSHNSSVAKAAVELNGTMKCDVDSSGKVSNVNLVLLHRRQYRSNNSVTTFTEASGASGAEMFYNPHQSTVARKFFRKQRRHMKPNNLGARRRGDGGGGTSDGGSHARVESAVFLSSDMENASNSVAPSVYAPGSKVNNTNIHIEHPHYSFRCKDSKNPNILTDGREDEGGMDNNDLPLERLVIGAEETSITTPSNDIRTLRGPILGSDYEPVEILNKPVDIPEKKNSLSEELKVQHVCDMEDNKLQCSVCENVQIRTDDSQRVESNKTEDLHETTKKNDDSRRISGTIISINCNIQNSESDKHANTDSNYTQIKICDNSTDVTSLKEQSKYLHSGSAPRNYPVHPNREKFNEDCSVIDIAKTRVTGLKPELLLKGKKLSLPKKEVNGYSSGEEFAEIDVPTPNKKETSV